MAKGFKHGGSSGGGASLNFRIAAYASEDNLPEAAAENTIAVITETAITGWIFSAAEPESPAEGLVWIKTGTSSEAPFNALAENSLMVFPLAAKQYVGGAWVNKTGKSFLDGAWTSWGIHLYNKGNEYSDITGGWEGRNDSTYFSKGTYTENAENITLSGSKLQSINAYAVTAIDITDYNTLYVNVISGTPAFGIITKGQTFVTANIKAKTNTSGAGVYALDISGFTGEYQISVWASSETASFSAVFDEVYLI